MLILLTSVAALCAVGGALGWRTGSLAKRRFSANAQLNAYRLFLAVSLTPYGCYLWHVAHFVAKGVGLPGGAETLGYYPGVVSFVRYGVLSAVGLYVLAAVGTRWFPSVSGLLPFAAFACHRWFVSDWLGYRMPGSIEQPQPHVDVQGAGISLIVASTGMTVFLVAFVWFASFNEEK